MQVYICIKHVPRIPYTQDSLVHLNDIHFDSPFEKHVFESVNSRKHVEPFNLLIANGSLLTELQIERSKNRLYGMLNGNIIWPRNNVVITLNSPESVYGVANLFYSIKTWNIVYITHPFIEINHLHESSKFNRIFEADNTTPLPSFAAFGRQNGKLTVIPT